MLWRFQIEMSAKGALRRFVALSRIEDVSSLGVSKTAEALTRMWI